MQTWVESGAGEWWATWKRPLMKCQYRPGDCRQASSFTLARQMALTSRLPVLIRVSILLNLILYACASDNQDFVHLYKEEALKAYQ